MAKNLIRVALFLMVSSLAFADHIYKTSFAATENPISETGQWINGLATGGSWGNVRTTPGLAFGTVQSTGCPGTPSLCNDSTAILTGSWGATQYAKAIVNTNGVSTACCHEIELRLRSTITAGVNKGYEINCSVSSTNTYIQVVRWNGALGSFDFINATDPGAPCANGDLLEAMISGGAGAVVVKVWRNSVLVLTATDNTGSAILSGAPGVGMFNNADATQNAFGLANFFACDNTGCPWLGIVAPSRITDFTTAGSPVASTYPFAVDSWTQCGSTIAAGASLTTVQNAINACTANHYVLLSAGTYNFSSGLVWNAKNSVALKGAGSNSTFLVFSGGNNCTGAGEAGLCFKSTDLNYWGSPSNVASWTAGYSTGSTSITLSSVTSLAVGDPLTLDQTEDPSDNGAIFVSSAACCASNGDGGSPRPGRSQQQIVTVTSISGTTVGISPAIRMPNWVTARTPQAWWPTTPISNSGFMDLSVDVSGPGPNGMSFAVQIFNCNGCFALRSRLVGPGVVNSPIGSTFRSLIQRFQTAHTTVGFNYFYGTPDDPSVNYGTEAIPSADDLILSNIFQHVQAPTPTDGTCSGCVVLYNFDINNIFHNTNINNWLFLNQGQFAHAVGDENILFEGNQGAGVYNDQFHGTHHFTQVFRDNYNGFQKDNGFVTTDAVNPIIMPAYNRFSNFLGNVLGNTVKHTIYKTTSSAPVAGTPNITLGVGFNGNDNNTPSTAMLYVNYVACTGGTGCNTTQANSSEVPSGLTGTQANFANPVPANTSLPGSFFYTAQPGWWPATKPWPAIGPDVTGGNYGYCSGGTNAGNYATTTTGCPGGTYQNIWAGHAYSLPARDCYDLMGGPGDGTGAALNYSYDNCYVAASGPIVGLSPSSINFNSQTVGVQSSVQTSLLSNSGTAPSVISSIVKGGTNAADFTVSNDCPGTLSNGSFCTISVTCTPSALGSRTASVTVTDDAPTSPQVLSLSCTGTGSPVAQISPSSLTFGPQNIATTSTGQGITLANIGTDVLAVTAIAIGGTNPGDFFQSNNCPVGGNLGISSSCTVTVTFTPTNSGSRTANIVFTTNYSGSPQTVTLSGTGISATNSSQINSGTVLKGGFVLK